MELSVLVAILGVLIFAGVLGIGYLFLGGVNLKKRLRTAVPPDEDEDKNKGWEALQHGYEKIAKPLGELIPKSPEEMSRQERRLVKAGIRRKDGVILFFGSKFLVAIFFVLIFAVTGWLWQQPVIGLLVAILLGMLLPDLWLKYAIAARTDRIQLALPNALDLAVVCVEAGMGLDQALLRIGKEMQRSSPELSDELNVFNLELRAGRPRADALRNLAGRSASLDLRSLTAVLIQTERFGTSIALSLRTFADTMRTTRRLRAEEHAAKMTIKMVPPLVFFIFPVILIVIAGPALIRIAEVLGKLANNN